MNYWLECLQSSFEEHGIKATEAQVEAVASDVAIARDNESLAFHVPESPFPGEIKRLEQELREERSKVVCQECRGVGHFVSRGGTFESRHDCHVCRGRGIVKP